MSAPIGSSATACESWSSEAHSSDAVPHQDHDGEAAAERRPDDDAAGRGRAGQVAGVVGRGVHPADAEAGHHQDRRADHRADPARLQGTGGTEVDVVDGQRDVDEGGRDHRDRQPLLEPHDRVEAEDAGGHDDAGDDQERDDLGEVAVAPAEPGEDGGGGEGRQRHQDRLPADEQQVGHRTGQRVAVPAERGAREHQRRGRPALPGDRDEADQQEGEHRADDARRPAPGPGSARSRARRRRRTPPAPTRSRRTTARTAGPACPCAPTRR